MILEAICTSQLSTPTSTQNDVFLQLAESFNKYLFEFSNQNLNETNVHFVYIKTLLAIHCNHLEAVIQLKKQPPHLFAASDSDLKVKLDRLNGLLKLLMKRYANFASIPYYEKEIFIRAFSLFETKWLHSAQFLLSNENTSGHSVGSLTNTLKGAIRFNHWDIYIKLFNELKKQNMRLNIINQFFPHSSVYDEFFSLKGKDLNHDLDRLLSSWQIVSYLPSEIILNDLKEFIKK